MSQSGSDDGTDYFGGRIFVIDLGVSLTQIGILVLQKEGPSSVQLPRHAASDIILLHGS